MLTIQMDMLQTAALAMLLFLLGRFIVNHVDFLNRCCIPAPVVGGLIFAILHLVTYQTGILTLEFNETLKDAFMDFFFTSVGFGASIKLLKKGALPVLIFLLLATIMVTIQDLVGVGMAGVFGLDGRMGLCMGSVPLVGGHGTSASFGQLFEKAGVDGALTVAVACATYGLVAGSLMGGPLGRWKIKKYNLKPHVAAEDENLGEPETVYLTKSEKLDSNTFLDSFVLIIIATGIGTYITNAFAKIDITLPVYIGGMIVALIIRNVADAMGGELPRKARAGAGNTSLNIFLGIALMTLKLWQLAELALPIVVILAVQTLLMYLFASFVVFRVMGADYEAAVMTAAFCGFGMGATPNAMANMLTIKNQYGPAPKAFFVVPLVGGMFIDFTNSTILTIFTNLVS